MFKFKSFRSLEEAGFFLRAFGIDFSLLLIGDWRNWRALDLRLPMNRGIYAQVWFLLVSLGRLDDSVYEDNL